MKSKKPPEPPPDGPTVGSVYDLFAGILGNRYDQEDTINRHPDVVKANDAVEARKEVLARDPALVEAEAALATARRKILVKWLYNQSAAQKVKREFEACGLTPTVQKKLIALVELVNNT